MLMKLAIVHDYLNQMGGAERVLMALHEIFPQRAHLHLHLRPRPGRSGLPADGRAHHVHAAPAPGARHHQPFLPLFPFAFESIDLREYDVVLSMSSGGRRTCSPGRRPATSATA